MHPILAQIGLITIYTYGVLVTVGVILGLLYARTLAARAGASSARDLESWDLHDFRRADPVQVMAGR